MGDFSLPRSAILNKMVVEGRTFTNGRFLLMQLHSLNHVTKMRLVALSQFNLFQYASYYVVIFMGAELRHIAFLRADDGTCSD